MTPPRRVESLAEGAERRRLAELLGWPGQFGGAGLSTTLPSLEIDTSARFFV